MAKKPQSLPRLGTKPTPPPAPPPAAPVKTAKAMPEKHGIAEGLLALKTPVADLVFDPANAKTHGEESIDAIKGSLVRFGQQKPIVATPEGVVIAGNGTLGAARALGWTYIACVRTKLEGSERTAFAIADNRTAEHAGWDWNALRSQLADLQDVPGVDEGWLREIEAACSGGAFSPLPTVADGDAGAQKGAVIKITMPDIEFEEEIKAAVGVLIEQNPEWKAVIA